MRQSDSYPLVGAQRRYAAHAFNRAPHSGFPTPYSRPSSLLPTPGPPPYSPMSNLPALIYRYEAGPDEPRRAIAGLSRAELMAVPIPGTWSLQQLLVHLYESDLVSVDRMRRLIAMPTPLLMDYDETAFIRELHP